MPNLKYDKEMQVFFDEEGIAFCPICYKTQGLEVPMDEEDAEEWYCTACKTPRMSKRKHKERGENSNLQ